MHKNHDKLQISAKKGAYILQITVPSRVCLNIPSLGNPEIRAGRYLYCGSAKGPGGIRARVLRHLKREKKPHWHVDRLTIAFGVEAFSTFEGATECGLVAKLRELDFTSQPYAKFGNSDCRSCIAHLVAIDPQKDLIDCGFNLPVFRPTPDRVF